MYAEISYKYHTSQWCCESKAQSLLHKKKTISGFYIFLESHQLHLLRTIILYKTAKIYQKDVQIKGDDKM